jgi:hypothetical protein
MKNTINVFIIIFLMLFFGFLSTKVLADAPPDPGGGGPGGGDLPVGGGAPLDGGITLLLSFGIAYGARKIYQVKK